MTTAHRILLGRAPSCISQNRPSADLKTHMGESMKRHRCRVNAVAFLVGLAFFSAAHVEASQNMSARSAPADQVLEWNQILIDTLIATNTANSSSQRIGAIVHTAIFDAYNGIEQRYASIFVQNTPPQGASRRAAV